MPRVSFEPDHRTAECPDGTTLLAAAQAAGVAHTQACGGKGRCSTCRVLVLEGGACLGPRTGDEEAMAALRHFAPDVRLACQAAVRGDVAVRRLVLDDEDTALVKEEVGGSGPPALGEERRLAILFADVRDFTAFSAAQPPYDVVHLLNRFFHRAHAAVTRWGGTVDNYMGDGVMALFGADGAPDATGRAVRAGLDLVAASHALAGYVQAHFRKAFRVGVGIHTGRAVLGAVGSGERRRLTAIGEAVNLASRVEAANKPAGTELLLSADAYAEVAGRVRTSRCHVLPLKGTVGMHELHEVTGWVE